MEFLRRIFGLRSNAAKTLITHARIQRSWILGYQITVQHRDAKCADGRCRATYGRRSELAAYSWAHEAEGIHVEYSSNPNPPNFGRVLRQLRQALKITQQELSDKSGLSEREIRNLELGRTRVPYRRSAQLLADALDLADEARAEFLSIARGDFPQVDLSREAGKEINHENGSSDFGTLQCEIVELRRECEALKHSLSLISEIASRRERH